MPPTSRRAKRLRARRPSTWRCTPRPYKDPSPPCWNARPRRRPGATASSSTCDAQDTLFGYVASSPILPQLRALSLPAIYERHEDDLDQEAPRFHHLECFDIGEIELDDEDGDFAERVRAALPNATFGQ